jgi:hypothetical protein
MKAQVQLGMTLLAVVVALGKVGAAEPNRAVLSPPVPPVVSLRSPVDSFRVLLLLPASERRANLASRTPEVQQRLIEKIREYQALPPDERELRLKATELQWYLKPLMVIPATNRAVHLDSVPESLREMVVARLEQWDKFPPAVQQMMLTNQVGPGYFVGGSAARLPPAPPSPHFVLRQRSAERFHQLFELTPGESAKVLASLSEAERRQMEKTLEAFNRLTPRQRKQCVASFAKFADLPADERQEFLRNAERWAQMPAAERQAWRELVSMVPKLPPLPELTRQSPPPLPRDIKRRTPATTNGG